MHIISLFSVLALNGVALATIDFNNWAPPGPGDVRGPCPAMNSLANHHIIPHDGRNVTVPHLVEVLGDVFNLSPELATVVSQLDLATAPDPTTGSFNLPDLDKHNAFEHDASLTRADFAFSGIPGDAKLDHALFAQFMSHFDGMDYITIPAAAAARYSRVQSSRAHTPGFTYTAIQQITSYAETIKYFRTMVDPTNGLTSKKFVRILFGNTFTILTSISRVAPVNGRAPLY